MDCELPLVAIAVVVGRRFEVPALTFGYSIEWIDKNIVGSSVANAFDDKSCGGLWTFVNFVFFGKLTFGGHILMSHSITYDSGEIVDSAVGYYHCRLTLSYISADFGVGLDDP